MLVQGKDVVEGVEAAQRAGEGAAKPVPGKYQSDDEVF